MYKVSYCDESQSLQKGVHILYEITVKILDMNGEVLFKKRSSSGLKLLLVKFTISDDKLCN